MKERHQRYPAVYLEVNRKRFRVQAVLVGEAERGEFSGMPLSHYVYRISITREDVPETKAIRIDYHGNFAEWAAGKPRMNPYKAAQIFADYVIDAGLSITKTPQQFIEAWAMDTDMAAKTYREFSYRRDALIENFRLTTDDIVALGNVFYSLEANGRLSELIHPTEAV